MASDGLRHLTFMCEVSKTRLTETSSFFMNTRHMRKVGICGCFYEILERLGVVKVMDGQCTFGLWCTRKDQPSSATQQDG